jgi:hypothetical protein
MPVSQIATSTLWSPVESFQARSAETPETCPCPSCAGPAGGRDRSPSSRRVGREAEEAVLLVMTLVPETKSPSSSSGSALSKSGSFGVLRRGFVSVGGPGNERV